MHPPLTYELRITLAKSVESNRQRALKEQIFALLQREGIESFVEGVVDALDLDFEYGMPQTDQFEQHGGTNSPISVYKYSQELLLDLQAKLQFELRDQVVLEIFSSPTQEWMDGWKESFKPISTQRFYVYPPWESMAGMGDKIPVVIEPGMAFGTGQHATTQLCLETFEQIYSSGQLAKAPKILDVGTGTGILAIAAVKLSGADLLGTDIDVDAIMAANANATANKTTMRFLTASLPGDPNQPSETYDLIFANILFVVLEKMLPDLAKFLKPGGHLVLSGLLEEDADRMLNVCKQSGLVMAGKHARDGWLCLYVRSRA